MKEKNMKKYFVTTSMFILSLLVCLLVPIVSAKSTRDVAPEPGGGGYPHVYDLGSFFITNNAGQEIALVGHYVYADSNYNFAANSIVRKSSVVDSLGASGLFIKDQQISGNFAWVNVGVRYPIYNHLNGSYYYYSQHHNYKNSSSLIGG